MTLAFVVPGLDEAASEKAIAILQNRLSQEQEAALVLKHAHWNVTGPNFIAVHEMLDPEVEAVLAQADETAERIAKMYLALGDDENLSKKVLDEMKLTTKWVLKIVNDEWPLQHRHVLGQAIRIRSPYVDALSVTQVLALGSLRKRVDKEELTHGQKENYTYLILCTVSGVAAGLQNTG